MENRSSTSFLDTSVVRSLMLGTKAYRQYLNAQLADQVLYISPYIQMEMRRSYLLSLIAFHCTLSLDTIESTSDALVLWSNRFKTSELKAILQVIPQLLTTHQLDLASPTEKETALNVLGVYIKRFDLLLRRKFEVLPEPTQCSRASVPLQVNLSNLATGLMEFAVEFSDTKARRAECQIDQVLLYDYCAEVESFIQAAGQQSKTQVNQGFVRIAENLQVALTQGKQACSCKHCEKVGDAVIALAVPRTMQLEHTDHSFDSLCPLLNQPHRKYPSEVQILKSQSSS